MHLGILCANLASRRRGLAGENNGRPFGQSLMIGSNSTNRYANGCELVMLISDSDWFIIANNLRGVPQRESQCTATGVYARLLILLGIKDDNRSGSVEMDVTIYAYFLVWNCAVSLEFWFQGGIRIFHHMQRFDMKSPGLTKFQFIRQQPYLCPGWSFGRSSPVQNLMEEWKYPTIQMISATAGKMTPTWWSWVYEGIVFYNILPYRAIRHIVKGNNFVDLTEKLAKSNSDNSSEIFKNRIRLWNYLFDRVKREKNKLYFSSEEVIKIGNWLISSVATAKADVYQ